MSVKKGLLSILTASVVAMVLGVVPSAASITRLAYRVQDIDPKGKIVLQPSTPKAGTVRTITYDSTTD